MIMAIGVQQEDVWAAADALLRAGEQPTIERVRQHLGRGSPNTVGPHLKIVIGGAERREGRPCFRFKPPVFRKTAMP
jgi:hypothetical protein